MAHPSLAAHRAEKAERQLERARHALSYLEHHFALEPGTIDSITVVEDGQLHVNIKGTRWFGSPTCAPPTQEDRYVAWSNKDEGRIRSRGWAKGLNSMAATRNRTAAKPAITEAPTPIPELAVLEGEATWAEVTGAASRLMNVIMRETGIEDIRRQPESDHVIIVVEGEPAIVGAGAGEARNENARLHVVVGGRRPTALPVGRAWIDKSGEALAVGPSAEVARRTDGTFDTVHLFRRK